jgi:transposase InsO family protein
VQRLMREHGIKGGKRRGKPWRNTKPDPGAERRPDLVNRNFTAEEPNRLCLGDLSYLPCWEGVVYFAFIIDVFSRRVVGWQLASQMRSDLVLDALRMALGTRRLRNALAESFVDSFKTELVADCVWRSQSLDENNNQNLQTQSPWNPVWLTEPALSERGSRTRRRSPHSRSPSSRSVIRTSARSPG